MRFGSISVIVAGVLLVLASAALGEEAPPLAADPAVEKRVVKLSEELRCLVCQNQSLSDSNADLANDLRKQVREMIQSGKTDEQIRDYMVASYGDFILYDPPLKTTTLVLWIGPFLLLVISALLLTRHLKRRPRAVANPSLSEADRERARALLNDVQDGDK